MGLSSFISVRLATSVTVQSKADYLAIILAWLTIPVLLITPIILFFMSRKLTYLIGKEEKTKDEYDQMTSLQPMYKDFSPSNNTFPSLFFVRRLALVFSLTVIQDKTKS